MGSLPMAPELPPTKVLQLRVGRVRKNLFSINGLHSAIFKVPVPPEPIYLGLLGLEGDNQGAPTHGGAEKAFMHYASSHYPNWRKELPESENLLQYGGFGENFLTGPDDGYNEHTICVGDIFAIGREGVRIQVTQPRQPCLKLNHRFEVRDMALRAQNLNRTGWHNRILVPGNVQPGDEMWLVERTNSTWFLNRVQHYMYVETRNTNVMKELIAIKELGEETRAIFRARVEKGQWQDVQNQARLQGPEGYELKWSKYRLLKKTKETTKISSLVFEAVEQSLTPTYALPGSHVRVKLGSENGNLVRAYSVVEGNSNCFTLGIARETNSRGGSNFFHEKLALGDPLMFSKFASDFPLVDDAECEEHIFIAGGIGITALLASARVLKQREAAFKLIYLVKSNDDIAFRSILNQLGDHVKYCFSQEGSKLDISHLLTNLGDRTHIYVCGPDRLLSEMNSTASTIGFPLENLHSEAFTTSASGDPFTVQIASRCKEIKIKEHESLLDVLRGAGFDVASSCEVGNCGTCRVGVKSGSVEHRGTGLLEEEKKDAMLSCVSRGIGTISLDL